MKITILFGGECPLPPEAIGAVEIRWYNVAKILAFKGNEVTLIGKGDGSIQRNCENFTCRTVAGFTSSKWRIATLLKALLNTFLLLRLVPECDILVLNNAWAMLLIRFFARQWKCKKVVNVARMPKGCFAARNHGADMFVCPTSAVARRVKALIPVEMESKVCVVPNPVDSMSFNADVHRPAETGQIVIGYHGRINREKGLQILAKAVCGLVEAFPDIRLKLIGPVDEQRGGSGEAYKEELNEILGNRIEWVTPIADRAQLAQELASCTIYCYPSVAENGETFGVAPLEAMSLGLPVVVSALECFTDFVKDGETGLIFDHRSDNPTVALKVRLKQLLDDVGLRQRIASAAASAAGLFSTEEIAKKYEELFRRLLNREAER